MATLTVQLDLEKTKAWAQNLQGGDLDDSIYQALLELAEGFESGAVPQMPDEGKHGFYLSKNGNKHGIVTIDHSEDITLD